MTPQTLYVINHSGGKDSQAMTAWLAARIPHDQLIVIHAPLGRIEWAGTISHIEDTKPPDGLYSSPTSPAAKTSSSASRNAASSPTKAGAGVRAITNAVPSNARSGTISPHIRNTAAASSTAWASEPMNPGIAPRRKP